MKAGSAIDGAVRGEHATAFLRLGQLWQRRSHFSLLLAAVDDSAYRDQLIGRLQAIGPAQRIDLAPADAPQDWLHRLQQAHTSGATRVQVCLPISPRRPNAWWHQANVLRERLADAFPAAQLVWMCDADVDAASHQAPDLWNWREAVFSFSASLPAAGLPTVAGHAFQSRLGQDAAVVAQRLGHIDRALASQPADTSSAAHLWLEAACAHQRLGHWPAADAAARRAASGFQQAGNAASQAEAQALLAELQWRRGDAEGALQALRSEVLPIFERLGDLRSKANTMGMIADILQARGQVDEALLVLLDEELPVYQRMGDVRSEAVALFKVADLQAAKGHRNQALRLLTKDVLPVFDRLGLAREAEITRQRIAVLRRKDGASGSGGG